MQNDLKDRITKLKKLAEDAGDFSYEVAYQEDTRDFIIGGNGTRFAIICPSGFGTSTSSLNIARLINIARLMVHSLEMMAVITELEAEIGKLNAEAKYSERTIEAGHTKYIKLEAELERVKAAGMGKQLIERINSGIDKANKDLGYRAAEHINEVIMTNKPAGRVDSIVLRCGCY